MKQARTPNPNPVVEDIMQAYMKTYLTERQFEQLIEKSLEDAKGGASENLLVERYDKGFSDGWAACEAESRASAKVEAAPFVYTPET